jgi:hypothetical protein
MGRQIRDTLLVTFGDIHCGSTRGLMPIGGIEDVDGNMIRPNPLQKLIYKQWEECWDKVSKARKGKRLVVVCMGDVVEGIHHETTQIVSQRVETHEAIAMEMIDGALRKAKFNRKKGDMLYFLAGTEEHTDSGSQSDERVAKDFEDAIYDDDNKRTTWELLPLDINGLAIDFMHHGATPGMRYHTKENSLRYSLRSLASEKIDLGERVPNLVYSAHYHTLVMSGKIYGQSYEIEGVINPSFQFKTGYAIKLFGTKPSDIGLVTTDIRADGFYEIKPIVMSYIQHKRKEI